MPDNLSSGKSENKPGNTISREHHDTLMNAPVGVFTAMLNGRVLYINAATARMLGYDTPEKLIDDITDIYSALVADPSDREKLKRLLEDQGEAIDFENRFFRRDQTALWVSCNIMTVSYHDGSVSHFDRALVEQSMEMTYLHDLDGNILEVNPASIRHTGYSRDEYSRMNVFDLHPDKTPNHDILRQWKEWRVGHSVTLEKIHVHKNGSDLPVEITTGKLRFGGRDYILAQVRDISRRKKAQDELRESEKRFATAFKSNPAPQVISDIETGTLIDANDRWLEMIGHTREEMIGRTSKETGIYADPDERDRIIRKLQHQGFFKDEPIALLTRTGETISALWSAEAITLSGRKVMSRSWVTQYWPQTRQAKP